MILQTCGKKFCGQTRQKFNFKAKFSVTSGASLTLHITQSRSSLPSGMLVAPSCYGAAFHNQGLSKSLMKTCLRKDSPMPSPASNFLVCLEKSEEGKLCKTCSVMMVIENVTKALPFHPLQGAHSQEKNHHLRNNDYLGWLDFRKRKAPMYDY
uniref:Uncharacterized protein n=1 Tax=Eptatretus burgeri TaxID=7764 RepID=A0A8C4NLK1_EPTBU